MRTRIHFLCLKLVDPCLIGFRKDSHLFSYLCEPLVDKYFHSLTLPTLSAEMNSTYNAVHDESITTWKFQRLGLVLEFAQSSVLPAPLGIFEDVWLLCSCKPAGSALASSHGTRALWAATCPQAGEGRISTVSSCCTGIRGAGVVLPDSDSALRYAQKARDWTEWMAAALVVNQQRSWGGWAGYFPPNWMLEHKTDFAVTTVDSGRSDNPSTDTDSVASPTQTQQYCNCAFCQQSTSLRQCADAVGEALEAWVRARAEGDKERTAALEAARAAAAAAERAAQLQAAKVLCIFLF